MKNWRVRILPAVLFLGSGLAACAENAPRVIGDFESADAIALIAKNAEAAKAELATDKGVTHGKGALKVAFQKGAQWASLVFDGDAVKGWDAAEAVSVDVFSDDEKSVELVFELFDARSTNHGTRCTFPGMAIEKGQRTLTWSLLKARRNEKENADWESLSDADKIELKALTRIKFFTTPPADRDAVVYFDNLRLIPKSAARLEAEQKEVAAAKSEKVIYFNDFENGKGLRGEGVPFKGSWGPLDENGQAEIVAPLGKGNDSQKVLSVKAVKKAPSICMELPMHHTVCEPEHWDAIVSMRLFNESFDSFEMTYSPIIPSDTTFHRVAFKAPKGEWTTIEMPLDKFLFQGRRPRRGCPLEYLCFIGIGPEHEGSSFQLDDFKIRRVMRTGLPEPKPKAALSAGMIYRQDYNDPQDFDIEGYYPFTKNCNVFRIPGGLDGAGRAVAPTKEDEAAFPFGCLTVECYEPGQNFLGGRSLDFPAEGNVIEFDCLMEGAVDLAVVTRGPKGKWRNYPKPFPTGTWTHVVVAADEFTFFGQPIKDPAQSKPSKAERFTALLFSATADKSGTSHVLIDNLVVRKADAPNEKGK